MREHLYRDVINVLTPYSKNIPFEDVEAQIYIILNDYEIESRKTEIIVKDEDKNMKYISMFLASKAAGGRTERTLHAYKGYLRKIFDVIGKNVDDITANDIKLYLAKKLRKDGLKKTSVDNERRALSTFYSWMYNNEYIRRNPMLKVEVMKYTKPKKKAFTDMEVEQIRNACTSEREKMIVEVLLSTWCRVSELCQIQIDEIDEDKVVVHGKGEKDRMVFLNAKAQLALSKYLEKRKDSNPFLLPRSSVSGSIISFTKGKSRREQNRWYEDPNLVDVSEPCDKGTIENIIRNLGKKASVNNVHPHRFRRTGATFALKAGMPIMTVSKLLGHSNIAVTQVYLDITDEDLENEHGKYVR